MQQIPTSALSNIPELFYVVLPDTMKLINTSAFQSCPKLCHVLITGPETQLVVNNGNETFNRAVKHFNAKGDEITVGLYVKCAGPNAWGKIDDATLSAAK
jgi:hypothetical protein